MLYALLTALYALLTALCVYTVQLQQSDNPEDVRMRTVIYSLLGPEGSLASQKVGIIALPACEEKS